MGLFMAASMATFVPTAVAAFTATFMAGSGPDLSGRTYDSPELGFC